MKKFFLIMLAAFTATFFVSSEAVALPTCPGSPLTEKFTLFDNGSEKKIYGAWHACFGKRVAGSQHIEGEFRNGKLNGKCSIKDTRDIRWKTKGYVGECKDGKKHGKGSDEDYLFKYEGQYRNDKKHGIGRFTWVRRVSGGDPFEYYGEFENGSRHGQGLLTFLPYGPTIEGTFYDNKLIKSHKTKFSNKSSSENVSLIRNSFIKLTEQERKQIQTNLRGLGFYNSKVDGLYGKGTKGALSAYNNQNMGGADLNKEQNVNKLIAAILAINSSLKKAPEANPDETYRVASGSGFYVSDLGHIITNYHVIDGCKDMKVHADGEVFTAKIIADDRRNDLAILKVSTTPKHALTLSQESPFPLQEIIVAGYPFGDKVSSTLKFTQGIVSAIAGLGNDYSQIQIDAAIQPGSSGGPILDKHGNVIGVAVAKLSLKKILKDYGVVPENTNFGVKASAVKNLLEGNGISVKPPNLGVISKKKLGKMASSGTVFLSCWMTLAQIDQMRKTKVLFDDVSQ